jgi:hypothetical protein
MAKPIETLSPADEAIFRTATLKSLQGAAEDPDRIGAEYLPLVIPVDGVQLAETAQSTLEANVLGLANGQLVLHNDADVGGEYAFGFRGRGAFSADVANALAGDLFVAHNTFLIPIPWKDIAAAGAADFTIRLRAFIVRMTTNYSGATDPVLGLYHPGSDQTTIRRNIYNTFDENANITYVDWCIPCMLTLSLGEYYVGPVTTADGVSIVREITSGVENKRIIAMTIEDVVATRRTLAIDGYLPCAFYLGIPQDTGGDATGTFQVSYDYELIPSV